MLNTIFRNLFNVEEPPNKVLEVKSDKIKSYDSRPVIYREESILLYGPKNTSDRRNNVEKSYEIVFHKYFTENLIHTYSLFRSEEREPAEDRFVVFKDKVPVYINVIRDCSVAILQKVCDTLSEYRSWTIAHLAAHYGQSELFNVPAIQAHMDEPDPLTGATPLMVAVKSCNTRMVQSLLSLNCSLDSADVDGNTIYHYAAASNRDIINALSSKSQTTLNVYNGQGYTPLHMACLANAPDCVRALLLAGADVNLSAVSRSHPSSMGALKGIVGDVLQDNQPKLYQEDMKHGGTPIHWACSREVIEVLVDKNCDINALNFDGRTALHVMVIRGRLDCVVSLLSLDAVHSIGDKEGNTPLHLAVKQNNISILQALIVFGADLEAKNDLGQTARHVVPIEMSNSVYDKMLFMLHSVGAKRCSELGVAGCRAGCAARGEYAGVAPAAAPRACTRDAVNFMLSVAAMERAAERAPAMQRTQGRLLCLDGGGIRGLVLIQILLNLEEAVGKPIIHCFDWVAGTSTGGILALALASNKTLRDCQRLYFKMKDHAFAGRRPYPPEPLENILKECLGTETVMTDIKHPKLMILTVMADRKPIDLHIFRNYQSPHDILDEHNGVSKVGGHGDSPDGSAPACSVVTLPAPAPPSQQLVWQAARSSGAAPSYFRASGRYLDGGLMGNNPTLDAMTELTELGLALRATAREQEAQKTNLRVVVSCGTGLIPVSRVSDIDVFKPEGIWEAVKLAYSLPAMANLLVDQATQADGRVVERARAWCAGAGAPYYRFSPQLSQDVGMDERNDAVLVNMLWETHRYMREHRDRITELAAMLAD